MPPVPDLDYLRAIRGNSLRFLDCLEGTEPGQGVPSCSDWSAADLAWHLGEVQHFWGTIVTERLHDPDAYQKPDRPESYPATLEFFREASGLLIGALDEASPQEGVWTWSDDHTVGFILRRQAHEALIHRVDAELASGQDIEPADPDLAMDGIHELMTVMVTGLPDWGTFEAEGVLVGIESTDRPGRWTIELGRFKGTSPNTGNTYDMEAGELVESSGAPDLLIQGEAWLLDRWLWGRADGEELTLSGDHHLAALLRQVITEATQ